MKVVLIGADDQTVEFVELSIRIRWPGVTPLVATTALDGLGMVERFSPEVVLIYPAFSDMSLSQTIQELRRFSTVPMLVLGNQGDEAEVITALESGADDYVRLPCALPEMMARVWVLLRRHGTTVREDADSPLTSGQLLLNPATHEVYLGDLRVPLTDTEFRLLHLLLENRGTVVSHQTLESTLWGDEADSSGLVKKYVQRVRRKLGETVRKPGWIMSIHGTGYQFVGSNENSGGVLVAAN